MAVIEKDAPCCRMGARLEYCGGALRGWLALLQGCLQIKWRETIDPDFPPGDYFFDEKSEWAPGRRMRIVTANRGTSNGLLMCSLSSG